MKTAKSSSFRARVVRLSFTQDIAYFLDNDVPAETWANVTPQVCPEAFIVSRSSAYPEYAKQPINLTYVPGRTVSRRKLRVALYQLGFRGADLSRTATLICSGPTVADMVRSAHAPLVFRKWPLDVFKDTFGTRLTARLLDKLNVAPIFILVDEAHKLLGGSFMAQLRDSYGVDLKTNTAVITAEQLV